MVKQFIIQFLNMKSVFDIKVTTASGDTFNLKGVPYSTVTQLSYQILTIKNIEIVKEYFKKISKY
jgi:hypothetical protein